MTTSETTADTTSAPAVSTRMLLTCGAIGGPLWAVVSLAQAVTRPGFDLTRHPLSALSNGPLGWLQITVFVVTGVLTVAGALGLRRVLRGAPGGTWVPRLVGVAGVGQIASGVLVIDPSDGFPVGTPAGMPETMSAAGIGHLFAGLISFAALIAACYVLGRTFGRAGHHALAVTSVVAGTALLVGNGWAMSGGRGGSLTLAIGAIGAMVWLSVVAAHHRRSVRTGPVTE